MSQRDPGAGRPPRPPSLANLAWRNLWRNRRRTLITLGSIVFGVMMAVLMTAMQDRNWAEMIDLAARMGGGHVTLQHPDYQDAPSLTRSISDLDALTSRIERAVAVERIAPRIVGSVMLNTARESFGAGFIAYDPTREDPTTLAVLEGVVAGEAFRSGDEGGILLGERLAANLGAELGDKVVYTLTDREGEITSGLARVKGLVRTGALSIDGGLCLLPIDALRKLVGYGADEATQLAVFLEDQRSSDRVADRLQAEVGGPVVVLPWNRVRPELSGFIAIKVGGALFMEILIAILVAAGIFNTLFVSVMERVREFGIMLAIGWSPGRLFRMVMLESCWLGIVGLVLAAAVTALPYSYLSANGIDLSGVAGVEGAEITGVAMSTVLKVGIYPKNAVLIGVFAFLAVVLSGIYPAWKAGRVHPVETLQLV